MISMRCLLKGFIPLAFFFGSVFCAVFTLCTLLLNRWRQQRCNDLLSCHHYVAFSRGNPKFLIPPELKMTRFTLREECACPGEALDANNDKSHISRRATLSSLAALAVVFPGSATAAVVNQALCVEGDGDACSDAAKGNPLIESLQRRSREDRDRFEKEQHEVSKHHFLLSA